MTTAQKTNVLEYSHTMGMTVMEGKGFYYPGGHRRGEE